MSPLLRLRLRHEAEADLTDAARWYESQACGLGHEFLDAVQDALFAIKKSPLLYPVVHRRTRRALIGRFPFGVYFRLEDDAIVVFAVMHGSRDPRRWKARR